MERIKKYIKRGLSLWLVLLILVGIAQALKELIGLPLGLSFLLELKPMLQYFLWFPFLIVVTLIIIAIFKIFFKEEKITHDLVQQEEEAKKIVGIFKDSCQGERALMLTGPWGVGKTSFYQASLKPEIKNTYPNGSIVEVSCFSIHNCDELILQILNKTFAIEWLGILLRQIKAIVSSSIQFRRALIPKETIIVIDDFEFSSFSGETYKDVLGLVQYLITVKKCHVFLIANEEEQCLKNKDNRYYHSFCQKIIRKYEYTPSQEAIYAIISRFKVDYKYGEYSYSGLAEQAQKLFGWAQIKSCETERKGHNLAAIPLLQNFRLIMLVISDLHMLAKELIDYAETIEITTELKTKALERYFKKTYETVFVALAIRNFHKKEEYHKFKDKYENNPIGKVSPDEYPFISKLLIGFREHLKTENTTLFANVFDQNNQRIFEWIFSK